MTHYDIKYLFTLAGLILQPPLHAKLPYELECKKGIQLKELLSLYQTHSNPPWVLYFFSWLRRTLITREVMWSLFLFLTESASFFFLHAK